MKQTIQNNKQRIKNLKNSLFYAVSNGFSQEVISSYQIQLISLLVEVAQDNYKKRQRGAIRC